MKILVESHKLWKYIITWHEFFNLKIGKSDSTGDPNTEVKNYWNWMIK